MADKELAKPRQSFTEWLWSWWIPSSPAALREAEKKILSNVKTSYRGYYVDIGPVVGSADKIWTISMNTDSEKDPLVLLHGLGSGVALWCLNLETLAARGPVHAVDLLGFGRSSRPRFSSNAMEAEEQFAASIEEWRKEMKIKKMVLLGHSMGGYIAAAYALRNPQQVSHVILADPWGFANKPSELVNKNNIPFWAQALFFLLSPLNPLFAIRAAGPFGHWLIEKVRPDLMRKFEPILGKDANDITRYLYHCNTQSPTGESAFHCMMSNSGCAKNPMSIRMDKLSPNVPLTLIYGSRSWVDNSAGEVIREKRGGSCYVNIQMISGAGHHVYADKYETFNKQVLEACSYSELKL